ncbi:hypothetical protein DFH09DRAFT_1316990 [Mycena vulgaris]|nr:hypothetical protein DFH09DRAFT_1316990 [Mycena vulgaris]
MPFNNDECYCAICDLRRPDHPECDYCKRRYLNKNTLRNHFIYSRHHHYCAVTYRARAGPLRLTVTRRTSVDDDPSIPSQEWEEEMGQLKYPDEAAAVSQVHVEEELQDERESDDEDEEIVPQFLVPNVPQKT